MKQATRTLIGALAYQMAPGIHTYGHCSADGCKRIARGSAHCDECIHDKIAKATSQEVANTLYDLYKKRGEIQSDIDELLSEL